MLISTNIPREILLQLDDLVYKMRKTNRIESPEWPFRTASVDKADLTPAGEAVLAQYQKDLEAYEQRRKNHRRVTVSRSLLLERIIEHMLTEEQK
jgi:hypothetical protein